MRKYRYAAYGSNLHPLRLQKRVPSAQLLGTSMLSGYELRFNKKSDIDGSGKCSINPADSTVYLAVYEIAIDERPTLDRIEGLGTGYDQLAFESEQYGDCVTYIANPAVIDETIEPMDWYKTMVLLGGRANRFPAEYLEFLDRFRATPDPDEARACMNWNIVKELRNGT